MINNLLKNYVSDTRATISVIFAGAIVPIITFVGVAVDYAQALSIKTRLQAAVDGAATAGARLPATANQNREFAAQKAFASNANQAGISSVSPTISANNTTVTVSASVDVATSFLGVVGISKMNVNAHAVAKSQIENGGVACLLALNPTSPDGLHLQGINKVSSENCWAWVNSTSGTAINATGASSGSAQGFCTVGGVDGPEHFQPAPYTECAVMDDPFFAKFENYNVSWDCDHTDIKLSSGTFTLTPGTYCGDTVFKPHAHVTLTPGTYVFRDGYLQVQAGASLSGNGVTLFFIGMDTMMEVRGGGNINLKAPTSGDLASFVIVDRKLDWYDPSIRETVVQGGGDIVIEGIVYAPQWKMNISGNGEINQNSKFFTMVADTFYLEGNGRLHVKSDAGAAGFPEVMPKIKTGPVILE